MLDSQIELTHMGKFDSDAGAVSETSCRVELDPNCVTEFRSYSTVQYQFLVLPETYETRTPHQAR